MDFYIRPSRPEDAAEVAAIRVMPGVMENIFSIPSEQAAQMKEYYRNLGPNQHEFTAVLRKEDGQEQVIGAAGLSVGNGRGRHCSEIGMMVHPQYQNQKVGRALMEVLLDLADNWLMLIRIELSVFTDNAAAIHLYEKFGFQKEGVKRMAGVRAGKYEDLCIMGRIRPGSSAEDV